MAVLGLDLGTSSVKALLLPDGGGAPAVASAPCAVEAPRPGWAEADPTGWLRAAGAAVRAVRDRAGDEPVRAVGLAGHMHGLVLCDSAGRPVRPAITWADRRASGVLDRWRALPAERRLALANPLVPGMAGPLLAWLAEYEPASLAAAAWALQPKDWLRLVLTGDAATEPSDASATLLWDVPRDAWADDVAAAVGVDARLLAPVVASDSQAGTLNDAGGEALGLPPGVPIHAGAADTAAALLGAGVTQTGQRLLNLGTGAQLVSVVGAVAELPAPTIHRYRTAGEGWYAMGAVQNAGLAVGWALQIAGASWEEAEREAFSAPPGAPGDPLFIPHLTGERTPLLDSDARGAWIGLALEHRRGDLLRAAYEGVAHAVRHAREALEAQASGGTGALRLLGGGSLRPGYRQLLADVLSEPLELLDIADATALGAALLAGGTAPPRRSAGTVVPDAAAARRLERRHATFRAAVAMLGALPRAPADGAA